MSPIEAAEGGNPETEPEAPVPKEPPPSYGVPSGNLYHDLMPREKETAQLHELLQTRTKYGNQAYTRAVVITGRRGLGKSFAAWQYVQEYGTHYRLILWIDASSLLRLTVGLVEAAPLLGLGHLADDPPCEIAAAVVNTLNSQTKWLMVLDDAPEDLRNIGHFLPSLRGTILATSLGTKPGTGFDMADYALPRMDETIVKGWLLKSMLNRKGDEPLISGRGVKMCNGVPLRMKLLTGLACNTRIPTDLILNRSKTMIDTYYKEEKWEHSLQRLEEKLLEGEEEYFVRSLVNVGVESFQSMHVAETIILFAHVLAHMGSCPHPVLRFWFGRYRRKNMSKLRPEKEYADCLNTLVKFGWITRTEDNHFHMPNPVRQAVLILRGNGWPGPPTKQDLELLFIALNLAMDRLLAGPIQHLTRDDLEADSALEACKSILATNLDNVDIDPKTLLSRTMGYIERVCHKPGQTSSLGLLDGAHRQAQIAVDSLTRMRASDLHFPYPHGRANAAIKKYEIAQEKALDALTECFEGSEPMKGSGADLDLETLNRMELDYALEHCREFIAKIQSGDLDGVLEMLKQTPYLAYFGHVDWDEVSGVVMCDNPKRDVLLSEMYPSLTQQEHLWIWTDLTDIEVAKLHGNDWEKKKTPIILPILEAVRTNSVEMVEAILNTHVDIKCCSPHDMLTPLQLAAKQGSGVVVALLLPRCAATYKPPYDLEAKRVESGYTTDVIKREWNGPSTLDIAMPCPESLLQVILDAPVQANEFHIRLADIMTTLQYSNSEIFRTLFDEGSSYHSSTPDALEVLLNLNNERAAVHLLKSMTYNECVHCLITTPSVRLLAFLFRFGPVRDHNFEIDGHDPIVHHIHHGHQDVIKWFLATGRKGSLAMDVLVSIAYQYGQDKLASIILDSMDSKK